VNSYIYLILAIVSELFGTSMLKASEGFTKLLPGIGVIVGFGFAFFFLSMSLKTIPLSIAYAIWSGIGTAATVMIGILVWKEKINLPTIIGVLLIIIGVVILNISGSHESTGELQNPVVETE
jgi:small multidrug resistance pump